MTITFENDTDVIIYALEKIIAYARENQYFFVANCTWWIASIIGLDDGLRRRLDNLASRQSVIVRGISTTPRDIARDISVETDRRISKRSIGNHVSESLRRTRQGRVNPLPKTKSNLRRLDRERLDELNSKPIRLQSFPISGRRLLIICYWNRIYGSGPKY